MNGWGPSSHQQGLDAAVEKAHQREREELQRQVYRNVAIVERQRRIIGDALTMLRAGHIEMAIEDLKAGMEARG